MTPQIRHVKMKIFRRQRHYIETLTLAAWPLQFPAQDSTASKASPLSPSFLQTSAMTSVLSTHESLFEISSLSKHLMKELFAPAVGLLALFQTIWAWANSQGRLHYQSLTVFSRKILLEYSWPMSRLCNDLSKMFSTEAVWNNFLVHRHLLGFLFLQSLCVLQCIFL